MFKYILILTVLFYVFYKVMGFFFRAGAAAQNHRQQRQQKNPGEDPAAKNGRSNGAVKGGEYIDYEEVK